MPLPVFGPSKRESEDICRQLFAVSGTSWKLEKVRFVNLNGQVTSGRFFVTEALGTSRFKEEQSPSAQAIAALKAKSLLNPAETLSYVGPNTTRSHNIIVVPIERARAYSKRWHNGATEPRPEFTETIPFDRNVDQPVIVSDGTPAPSTQDFSRHIDALNVLTREIHYDGHRAQWGVEQGDNPGLLIHVDTSDALKLLKKLGSVGVKAESYEFNQHTLIVIKPTELEKLLETPTTRVAQSTPQGRAVDDGQPELMH